MEQKRGHLVCINNSERMVKLSQCISPMAPSPCELKMESGRIIRYVAPQTANPRTEMFSSHELLEKSFPRRRSVGERPTADSSSWEGVNCLCQALDCIVEMDMETSLFQGKTVLEIGFATGLPSVYAWENGASNITLHNTNKLDLEVYTKPTFKRNTIPSNKCKFTSGDMTELKKRIGGKKFDVILAPDLLNRSVDEYELLHDIIVDAIKDDGICLLSAQSYYFNVDGCLSQFLSLVKRRRQLDSLERWSSPSHDVIQNKVIQLTRSLIF